MVIHTANPLSFVNGSGLRVLTANDASANYYWSIQVPDEVGSHSCFSRKHLRRALPHLKPKLNVT